MKTELIDVSPTRKEIKIEIEPAVVREAYDRISDEYAKKARVPGFRPGHAPRSVVRTRFKSEIRADALQALVPDAVNAAISEHTPSAIGQPDVQLDTTEALEKFGEEPLSVRVNVEVLPEVELKDYKGLEISRKTRPITDTDVEQMIEAFRETSATLLPVEDRPSQPGDTVTVSVDGKFLDNPEEENIKAEDVEVNLGGEGVQPEFTNNLTGVKVDDEKTFIVAYPQDFNAKDLAGKRVEYATKVTAVRVKELPQVDDEWARSLGEELDSVETMRARMREDLEARASQEADDRVRSQLLEKLLKAHEFEVPATLVEHQTGVRLQSVLRKMMSQGVDPRQQEIDWQGAREELKDQAQADVRSQMLLERIADEEKIDVSKEEIDAEIEAIALSSKQPVEQVRSVLTKDGGERSIANRLRNRKALDFLVANAAITDEDWQEEVKSEE